MARIPSANINWLTQLPKNSCCLFAHKRRSIDAHRFTLNNFRVNGQTNKQKHEFVSCTTR